MDEAFDPYYVWLGISPKDQPPNHYRLLGIDLFESEPKVIESAADRQMTHLRMFQAGEHSVLSQQLLNEVAKAKITLLNPAKKGAYDKQLKAEIDVRKPKPAVKPLPRAEAAATARQPAAAEQGPRGAAAGDTTVLPSVAAVKPHKPTAKPWLRQPLVLAGIGGALALLIVFGCLLVGGSLGPASDEGSPLAEAPAGPPAPPPAPPAPPAPPVKRPAPPPPVAPKVTPEVPPTPPLGEQKPEPKPEVPPTPPQPKVAAPPGSDVRVVDLLPLISQASRTPSGTNVVVLPVIPQGSFEWEIEFTRRLGSGTIAILFPLGDSYAHLELSGFGGRYTGLVRVDGHHVSDSRNPTQRTSVMPNNVRHKVALRVQFSADKQVEITATLNGDSLLHWKGPQSALSPDTYWKMPRPATLGLGGIGAYMVFHRAQLRMLDGQAKLLEEGSLIASTKPSPTPGPPPKDFWALRPGSRVSDVLRHVKPAQHTVSGTWQASGGDVTRELSGQGRILIPVSPEVSPEGRYELLVEFTWPKEAWGTAFLFPAGNTAGYVELGASSGKQSGVGKIGGVRANDPANPTCRPCSIAAGVRHKLALRVQWLPNQQIDVQALVDDQSHLRWTGAQSSLSEDDIWKLPRTDVLAVGSISPIVVHSVILRMIEGQAKLRTQETLIAGTTGPSTKPVPPEPVPPAEPLPPTPVPKAERQPVPQGETLRQAQGLVRDLYGAECQQAKTEQQKSALARKLLKRAEQTSDDPPGRYALLLLAQQTAIEAADGKLAWETIDRVAENYQVTFDVWERKAEIVTALARQARRPDERKPVVQLALTLMDQAQGDEAFAVAEQLGKLALAEASKVRERELLEQVRASIKQLDQAVKGFAQVKAAIEVLKDKPADGQANLTAGRYFCLVKGDWEKGLPHLAKGSDAALSQAAQQDLKSPEDAAAQLQVADAWWDLGTKAHGPEQDSLRLRAGYWYKQLLNEPGGGLTRARIEKRLGDIAKIGRPVPSVPAGKMPRVVLNSIGMKLVFIPAGEFVMGAPDSEKDAKDEEKPAHRVRISRPFYIGMYEVTQGEFQRAVGRNPSYYCAGGRGAARVTGQDTSRYPAECVSFNQAAEFCMRLSQSPDELRAGRVYRLPTEAEWEYACRAGTTTAWSCGDRWEDVGDYAWTGRNAQGLPHPVGEKKPNPWGLYDVHGNVAEWCLDWYDKDYYKASPLQDPQGPAAGKDRVLRGGDHFFAFAQPSRSAARMARGPGSAGVTYGFRVVMLGRR